MTTLTVRNAEIRTAAVEIKTLTVSGKQVTLAVFRQILSEQLIAADGTLRGIPWGTVNYHSDKMPDSYWGPSRMVACDNAAQDKGHIHVVWQKGTELRRTVIPAPHHNRDHPTRELWAALGDLPQLFIAV
jgi:hypothetical protein